MVDVADTSETMMGLNTKVEQRCRSKEPIVLVEYLDVTNLRKMIMLNIAATVIITILLMVDCKGCGIMTKQRFKQPILCTISWLISALTLLAVTKYYSNLQNYD